MTGYRKISLLIGLTLFALNGLGCSQTSNESPETASAERTTETPLQQELRALAELFSSEQGEAALAQFQDRESELVTQVEAANDPVSYTMLGKIYFYSESDSKALKAFDAALKLDPDNAQAHCFTGLVHRFANDLERAEASFNAAIAASPDNSGYHLELGRTLEMKGDVEGAALAYEKSLAIDGENFEANYSLAVIFAKKDDFTNTEKYFQAAIKARPDDLDSHYNLGQLYQTHKKPRAAIEKFTKVLEIDPNEWQAIGKLVQENAAIGDDDARDAAVEQMYKVWRSGDRPELGEQAFYIREQIDFGNDKIFALEYFEIKGERAKKYVFHRQEKETEKLKFRISLGSYDSTTSFSRAKGSIGPDERLYHLDGYGPDGSHYTYGFFNPMPDYNTVKDLTLKAFRDEQPVISSTKIKK